MGIFDIFRRKIGAETPTEASGAMPSAEPAAPVGARGLQFSVAGMPRWVLAIMGCIVLAFVYWGIIGAILSDTDADLTLRPRAAMLPPGGSVAVGTAALLLDNAINVKGWTPNDCVFRPTALLEDMPAFQRGLHAVIASFAVALSASVDGDPDLADAAIALETPPDRGWLHGSFPFFGGSAESRYGDAVTALTRYNRALGDGGESFGEARQLQLILIAMDRALAERAAAVDKMVDSAGTDSPDARYQEVRGSAYAAAMLMRGLRDDFGRLIRERQLAASWAEATESLDAIAETSPFTIGRADLVEQGYFLLRARDSLRSISSAPRQ